MLGQVDVILLFPGAFARQWEKGSFFSRPGWQGATCLQGQPESFMHLKDLHQSHRDLPLLQLQELHFKKKKPNS